MPTGGHGGAHGAVAGSIVSDSGPRASTRSTGCACATRGTARPAARTSIAVLDTGVQAGPPAISSAASRRAMTSSTTTPNAYDDNGHGTWVAGHHRRERERRVRHRRHQLDRPDPAREDHESRAAPAARPTSLRASRWAANPGADVINMSVGGFPYSQAIQDAVNYAWSKGAVLVGAAGNNRRDETFYPASFDHVVSVSATQPEDEFSNWSSYGPKVDVSAPGSSVLTTNCTAARMPSTTAGGRTPTSAARASRPERVRRRRAHPGAIPEHTPHRSSAAC